MSNDSAELPGVITEHWAATASYVRTVADLMGLRDHEIRLAREPIADDSDRAGTCQVTYGRRSARIHLLDSHDDAEELRNTVVHELLHVHLQPVQWHINALEPLLGTPAFTLFDATWIDHQEIVIDGLAAAWAPTLPLPAYPKGDTP